MEMPTKKTTVGPIVVMLLKMTKWESLKTEGEERKTEKGSKGSWKNRHCPQKNKKSDKLVPKR